ncbi:MAG: 2-isopropylmalate synthase [Candidatus Omnitrophica bacterium]|nr:2-isopropylmalate synthase [Candidatus Omnitrophota bacterium]MDD5737157.1 2-isopropylmalate synthase [Candidatus Omnitrophota bacterium]
MRIGEIKFNKKTNTLEEEYYRYELQDVGEPNLFREIYNYSDVPKVVFNHRIVPMNPPDDIWITDTTFRDGQQSLPPFTVKQITDLYDMLHKLGGPGGLIRQCEFFLYTDKDKEAVQKCLAKGYKFPHITGWIRPVKDDFKLVKEMGLKETGILTSASDYHIFLKLKKSRKQAMDMYLGIVKAALDMGIVPRCHLEDITRADFYGFVVPFVQELMELSKEAKIPIKIRACDTMGYGVTYPGVALPRSVKGIIYGLVNLADVPPEQLEWHGHNDFHHGLINATTSWLYGCCAVNGALLGIGERTGNTPIEALVMEYLALRGVKDGIDTTVITDIAEYFEKEIGYEIPHNQPFVGRSFNTTSAGIHADGLMKDEEIYNVFNTEKILKKKVAVAINDKSGVAGIAKWLNLNLNIKKEDEVGKDNPGVMKIKEWVDSEFAKGRTTSISKQEMVRKAKKFLPDLFGSDTED